MRIIGGEHRGRRLFAPEGQATRPTSEKVREALFDILGSRVEGATFCDLYAGTGAVGLEALSRGAASCVFVERQGKALGALRRNIEMLGAARAARVLAMDAVQALKVLEDEGHQTDLLFCDPPYADARWPVILAGLGERTILAPRALVLVEHAVKVLPACPEGLQQGKSYKYGDTGLTIFEKTVRSEG